MRLIRSARPRPTPILLASALTTLAFAGCSRQRPPLDVGALLRAEQKSSSKPAAHRPASLASSQRVAGAWDLVERRDLAAPHQRSVSVHELQLRWLQGSLVGTWDRERRLEAAPGQVYRATDATGCRDRRRLLVQGIPHGNSVRLERIHTLDDRPRCDARQPIPETCQLQRRGLRLSLRCGATELLFTRRRQQALPLMLALARPGGLTGVWTWHHRSVDPEGDLKIEHETWHLFQKGRRVEGFYDRVVRIRSRDGRPFSCNEALGYANAARFRVRGLVVGGEVYLKEVSYTTAPSTCETGRRRLDRYIGKLSQGGRIQLRWPSGAQLLRRRR